MSIFVQNYIWRLELQPSVKYVAIALADHAHDDGQEARPSQDFLANKTGLSVRHVRRCLKELVELGIIRVVRPAGKGRCTVYAFTPPKEGFGRTFGTVGRTSKTVWEDMQVPLTIKNLNYKKEAATFTDEVRIAALAEIRKTLRSPRSR